MAFASSLLSDTDLDVCRQVTFVPQFIFSFIRVTDSDPTQTSGPEESTLSCRSASPAEMCFLFLKATVCNPAAAHSAQAAHHLTLNCQFKSLSFSVQESVIHSKMEINVNELDVWLAGTFCMQMCLSGVVLPARLCARVVFR